MPDAFRQFYLDCEGKQSIKQLCLSIKMAVSELTVWYLFAALIRIAASAVLRGFPLRRIIFSFFANF